MSSGANVHAAVEYAKKNQDQNSVIVCILCDFCERYYQQHYLNRRKHMNTVKR